MFTITGRSKGVCVDAIMIYPEGEARPLAACEGGSAIANPLLRHESPAGLPDGKAVAYNLQGKALQAVDNKAELKAFLRSGSVKSAVVVRYANGNTVTMSPTSW
jgi:hypothetical protein